MGRPIKRSKLTQLAAYIDGDVIEITRQRGSKRFLLSDGDIYALVAEDQEDLATGQMSLKAHLPDDSTITVAKISSRKLTGSDGNVYGWTTSEEQVTPEEGFVWVESFAYWEASQEE